MRLARVRLALTGAVLLGLTGGAWARSAPPRPGPRRHPGFQKAFAARLAAIAQAVGAKPIEIWFAQKARVGQKNTITRR